MVPEQEGPEARAAARGRMAGAAARWLVPQGAPEPRGPRPWTAQTAALPMSRLPLQAVSTDTAGSRSCPRRDATPHRRRAHPRCSQARSAAPHAPARRPRRPSSRRWAVARAPGAARVEFVAEEKARPRRILREPTRPLISRASIQRLLALALVHGYLLYMLSHDESTKLHYRMMQR